MKISIFDVSLVSEYASAKISAQVKISIFQSYLQNADQVSIGKNFHFQLLDVVWSWNLHWGFALTNILDSWRYLLVHFGFIWKRFLICELHPNHMAKVMTLSIASFFQSLLCTIYEGGEWVYDISLPTVYVNVLLGFLLIEGIIWRITL